MGRLIARRAVVPAALVMLVTTGCQKGGEPATPLPPPAAGAQSDQAMTPEQLFGAKCGRCHSTNEQQPSRAPNLAHVASEEGHDVDWFVSQIEDPKSHKPTGRMPSFKGRLQDDQIKAIAGYVATLK